MTGKTEQFTRQTPLPQQQSSTKHSYMLGLVVVFIAGGVSWVLAGYVPRLGSVTLAILLGIVVGNAIPDVAPLTPGAKVAEKRLLPVAIALLGVELQLATLVNLGGQALLLIFASVATALLTSIYLGRALGYSLKFSLLMGAGNGICGSSAVAATSSAIHAEEKDIGISISVVNLLGTVGIFLMPAVVRVLAFDDTQSGMLIGGSLQAVGQVVAAGFSVNDMAGGVATVVKMGRVLMLAPVVILLTTVMQRRGEVDADAKRRRISVPLFIVGFFALSVISSLNILPTALIEIVNVAGKFLLVVAMVGIGMRIQLQTLYRSAPRALMFGALVSLTQIIVLITLIRLL